MVKKVDINHYTGAVSVEGDITPITREPIEQVDSANWSKMSVSDLHKQREILQRRYWQALGAGLMSGATTIDMGIKTIDALLENMGGESIGFL